MRSTEAIAAASKAIEHGNDYGNALLLFRKLFEKDQGVTEALAAATLLLRESDDISVQYAARILLRTLQLRGGDTTNIENP